MTSFYAKVPEYGTLSWAGHVTFFEDLKMVKNWGHVRPSLVRNGVLCGSVVKCLTRNPGILGSNGTESSGFFVGVSLGKLLQSPSLVLVNPGQHE